MVLVYGDEFSGSERCQSARVRPALAISAESCRASTGPGTYSMAMAGMPSSVSPAVYTTAMLG
jgi:hypothetical protein